MFANDSIAAVKVSATRTVIATHAAIHSCESQPNKLAIKNTRKRLIEIAIVIGVALALLAGIAFGPRSFRKKTK